MKNKMKQLWRYPKRNPVLIGFGMVSVGAVGFYLWNEKRSRKEDQEELPQPVIIDENHPVVAEKKIREVFGDEVMIEDDPFIVSSFADNDVLVKRNIFAANDDEWNYEVEKTHRSTEYPYVIHKDEFFDSDTGYGQHTLTYYAGDNILANEEETPVYNHSIAVGELRFGHGSGDPNVFYVRNDKLKMEFEILRDSGLYSREVEGLDIENNDRTKDLKHSDRRFPKE